MGEEGGGETPLCVSSMQKVQKGASHCPSQLEESNLDTVTHINTHTHSNGKLGKIRYLVCVSNENENRCRILAGNPAIIQTCNVY